MINSSIPNVSEKEKKNLIKCIKDNYISAGGEFIQKFSKEICRITKSKYCVLTSSGSSALHTALLTIGVKKDDLIIVPSFTFIASVSAIKLAGAEPWFFDISNKDWSIDTELLHNELKKNTYFDKKKILRHKKTKQKITAIMPVYTLGQIANIKEIKKIANKYKLKIIADAACAIGAEQDNKKIGEIGVDISTLSFNGNKTITSGGGGALIFNKKKYENLAKIYSNNGRTGTIYSYSKIGFNYRMNNIQAAIGFAQIKKIKKFIKKKKYIRNYYNDNFKDFKTFIDFFPEKKNYTNSYWLSGLILKKKKSKTLREYLIRNNIECRQFWQPIDRQKPYLRSLKTNMDVTKELWNKIIILPSSTGITLRELEKVKDKIIYYFRK
jgi:perosamine synthetase